MNNLIEGVKKIWEKFKSLGRTLRIAIIVSIVTLVIAIISMFFYSSANKYKLLFSGLDPYDAQLVTQKLTESKVDMKIEGDAILVPSDMVDKLRLEIAPELTSGSQGYELMDSGSSFGMTDEEFKIKKVRMLQGELEKTIKSFSQVADARVHITAAKDSVFITDAEPGKAAVYIKLNPGNILKNEQVESIIALVSGSTDNIPKENIEVMDENMNLLSKDVNNDDPTYVSSETIQSNLALEKQYEEQLQKSIVSLLTPVMGKNKVNVVVNADLDFDSKQKTETIIDPNKVIVSQQSIREENNDSTDGTSSSPVDENMSNTIETETSGSNSLREEQTTNYEVGKTENIVISAPGEVRRLTASVIVDGALSANLQTAVEQAVQTAIGYSAERGDAISVVGINFDPSIAEENSAVTDPFADTNKTRNLIIYALLALLVVGIIIGIVIVVRNKKVKEEKDLSDTQSLLDIVIDDKISKIEEEPLAPINFEVNNAQAHLEKEIQNYASDKPEQVADIIKSWLAEGER